MLSDGKLSGDFLLGAVSHGGWPAYKGELGSHGCSPAKP